MWDVTNLVTRSISCPAFRRTDSVENPKYVLVVVQIKRARRAYRTLSTTRKPRRRRGWLEPERYASRWSNPSYTRGPVNGLYDGQSVKGFRKKITSTPLTWSLAFTYANKTSTLVRPPRILMMGSLRQIPSYPRGPFFTADPEATKSSTKLSERRYERTRIICSVIMSNTTNRHEFLPK